MLSVVVAIALIVGGDSVVWFGVDRNPTIYAGDNFEITFA